MDEDRLVTDITLMLNSYVNDIQARAAMRRMINQLARQHEENKRLTRIRQQLGKRS